MDAIQRDRVGHIIKFHREHIGVTAAVALNGQQRLHGRPVHLTPRHRSISKVSVGGHSRQHKDEAASRRAGSSSSTVRVWKSSADGRAAVEGEEAQHHRKLGGCEAHIEKTGKEGEAAWTRNKNRGT